MLPYEKRQKTRTILVKSEGTTNPEFGKDPKDRTVEELLKCGIVNVNKPKGPTSHQVSEYVKKIFKQKKAGQSGTLDPAVTGVLPVGINRATRALEALLNAGKEYVCLMHIHKPQEIDEIKKACKKQTGKIRQLPPIKSAVKRDWRIREIYYFDILEISENKQDVLFRVGCQAGTYVRRICDDIGKDLGCGAHMAQLVRSKVGIFTDDNMVTLQELEDYYSLYKKDKENKDAETKLKEFIKPVETAIEHLPKVWIHDSAVPYICNGMDLVLPGVSKLSSDIEEGEIVAILTLKDELVALGNAKLNSKSIIEEKKGVAVKVFKVLMEQGIYKKQKRDE